MGKAPRMTYTEKSAGRFVGEITGLLMDFGAKSHAVIQGEDGPEAIAFVLSTDGGDRVFRLDADVQGVRDRMEAKGVLNRSKAADPVDVAWGQIRHLIEFQLEVVANRAMKPAQVFGGLALTSADQTVAQVIEEGGDALPGGDRLLLPGGG